MIETSQAALMTGARKVNGGVKADIGPSAESPNEQGQCE
jgi:hypothetical protein